MDTDREARGGRNMFNGISRFESRLDAHKSIAEILKKLN